MFHAIQGAAVVVFLALILRLALLLGATPVGSMTQEILYLRGDVFRPMVRVVLLFLLLEGAQLLLPALVDMHTLQAAQATDAGLVLDAVQAVLLVILAAATLRAFAPYSRRSLAELEVVARRSVEAVARRITRRPAQAGRPRRGA
ncbi:MAG TPA: hypothetical protein VGR28_01920 [Candidatus Thermoplasmatota archaeon]|nr:hypothetical protein [Candidatus Thermoplasmatota archaeon]